MGQNISQKLNKEENKIRFDIMNFIIDNKKVYSIEGKDYQNLNNIYEKQDLNQKIKSISQKGGFVLNEQGEIGFAYPVSAYETHHKVSLSDGRSYNAMCAIDAIGSAFTFGQNTKINSICSYCGEKVFLEVVNGEIVNHNKEDLHALSFRLDLMDNWAASCWNVMNYFCSFAEFDKFITENQVDMSLGIKCNLELMLKEAKETFEIRK